MLCQVDDEKNVVQVNFTNKELPKQNIPLEKRLPKQITIQHGRKPMKIVKREVNQELTQIRTLRNKVIAIKSSPMERRRSVAASKKT